MPQIININISYEQDKFMISRVEHVFYTVKPVLSGHSKRRPKLGFQDRLSLNAGQK